MAASSMAFSSPPNTIPSSLVEGWGPTPHFNSNPSLDALEGGHDKVRNTVDGLGTLNTEEINGPRLRPMAH